VISVDIESEITYSVNSLVVLLSFLLHFKHRTLRLIAISFKASFCVTFHFVNVCNFSREYKVTHERHV